MESENKDDRALIVGREVEVKEKKNEFQSMTKKNN